MASFNYYYRPKYIGDAKKIMKVFLLRSILFFGLSCLFTIQLSAQQCLVAGFCSGGVQYPSGTFSSNTDSWTTVSTLNYAGEYGVYNVTSGSTYQWSLCSADGGIVSYDAQLTLINNSSLANICYSNDQCSANTPKIQWTATFTGTVRVLISLNNCSTNSTFTTIVWRCSSCGSGSAPANDNCSGATTVTVTANCSSPTNGTVSGATNSLVSPCVGTSEDDVWHKFTTGSAGNYVITVVGSSDFDAVVDLRSGACNGTNIPPCADNSGMGGTEVISATLSASTTYFVRVYDYYSIPPTTSTFTICVTNPSICQPYYSYGTGLGDFINRVQLSTLDNTPAGTGGTAGAYYNDYYSTVAAVNLQTGTNQTLSVTVGTEPGQTVTAWIDYNGDGDLVDAGENIGEVTNVTNGGTAVINFTVSASATAGNKRMRVRTVWNNTLLDPCATYSYGEAEDYKVNIQVCTTPGTPTTLNTSSITATTATLNWVAAAGSPSPTVTYKWAIGPGSNVSYEANYTQRGITTSPTVTAAIAGLTQGDTYYWTVKGETSCNSSASPYATPITFQACTNPGIPNTLSTSSITSSTATLNWVAAGGSPSPTVTYKWAIGSASNVTYEANYLQRGITTSPTVTAAIAGLAEGNTYYWTVKAVTSCNSQASSYPAAISFKACTTPGTPTLNAPTVNSSDATLSWTANATSGSPTVTYKWAIGPASNVTYEANYSQRGITTDPTTTALVTGLTGNTTYYYTVKAESGCNSTASGYPAAGSFTTTCIIPGTPTSLATTTITNTSATLNWAAGTPAGSPTVTYYWAVNTTSTVDYETNYISASYRGTTTSTSVSLPGTGLTAGTTYYWVVKAKSSCDATPSSYPTALPFTTIPLTPLRVWTGATSSEWNLASNWSPSDAYPAATDHVIIPDVSTGSNRYPISTFNLSVNNTTASRRCLSLTIDAGASVTLTGGTSVVYISGNVEIKGKLNHECGATNNAFQINSGGKVTVNNGAYLNVGSSSISSGAPAGTINTVNDLQINSGGQLIMLGGTIFIQDALDFVTSGLFRQEGGITSVCYSGIGTANSDKVSIPSGCTFKFINGTFRVSGDVDGTATSWDAIWFGAGSIIDIQGGTIELLNGTTASDMTLTFAQATTFPNLIINKSGKTVLIDGYNISVNGNITLSSGTLNANGYNISLAGNLSNNGGTFTGGSGTLTLTGTGKTIDGTAAGTFSNLTMNSGSNYTFNPSYGTAPQATVSGTFTFNSGANLTISSGKIIELAGATNILNGVLTATNYDGTGDLRFSNVAGSLTGTGNIMADIQISSGTTSLGSNFNIKGDWILNTGTMDLSSWAITCGGNFTNNGVLTASTGTINFTGSGKLINGSSATTFNVVNFNSGSAYTINPSSVAIPCVTFSGNLTINSNASLTLATSKIISLAGGTNTINGTLTAADKLDGTRDIGFNNVGGSLACTGDLNADIQISSGTTTLTTNMVVNGDFFVNTGTFTMTTHTLTLNGNYTNNGTFNCGTGTLIFTGTSKNITGNPLGTSTFNHLTFQTSSSVTFNPTATNWDVNGTFSNYGTTTIASGKFFDIYSATADVETVVLDGTITAVGANDLTKDLDLNNSVVLTVPGTVNADINIFSNTTSMGSSFSLHGDLILSTGIFAIGANTLTLYGNYKNNGTLSEGTGNIIFAGSGKSITGTAADGAASEFNNVTFQSGSSYTFNPTASNWDIEGSFLNYGSTTIASNKFLDLYAATASGESILLGGVITATTLNDGVKDIDINNNVVLTSSATATINADINIYSGTTTLGSDLTTGGGFSMTGTTPVLTMTTQTFTVGGDWNAVGGTFNSGTGTVVFNGTNDRTLRTGSTQTGGTINGNHFNNVHVEMADTKTLLMVREGALDDNNGMRVLGDMIISNGTLSTGGSAYVGRKIKSDELTNIAAGATFNIGGSNSEADYGNWVTEFWGDLIINGSITTTRPISSGYAEIFLYGARFGGLGTANELGCDIQLGIPDKVYQISDVSIQGDVIVQVSATLECTNTYTLTVGGDFYVYENLTHYGNVIVKGNFRDQAAGSYPVNSLILTNSTFNFSQAGTKYISFSGMNPVTFNNVNVITESSGSREIRNDIIVTGDLTIESGEILDAYLTSPKNITLSGSNSSWTNDGTFTPRTGTVSFTGGSTQSIGGGTATTFYNMTVNKANSSELVLGKNAFVTNTLTLTNGYISTASSKLLTLNDGSSISYPASPANSFVRGPMKKIGATNASTFIFPVGKNSRSARIAVTSNSTSATNEFTAEYFENSYSNTTTLSAPITQVSAKEYWQLDRGGASPANAAVTLYWEDASWSGINSCATDGDLVVAHWNDPGTGLKWYSEGSPAVSGTCSGATSGTVKSNILSTFSPFAFGSRSGAVNLLPVELLSFDAKLNGNKVDLFWTTSSEINNDYFIVQRSRDMENFENIASVKGAGNSSIPIHYTTSDDNPLEGVSYYRLKQTDFDGTVSYSKAVPITISRSKIQSENNLSLNNILIYPNPSDGLININFENKEKAIFQFIVYDIMGRQVQFSQKAGEEGNVLFSMDLREVPTGTYILVVQTEDQRISHKLIIQR